MDDCEAMCDLRKFHWGDRCCSVTKSCSTLCDPMDWLSRFLCPLLSPGIRSHSCPLSQWWHLTISSSAAPFSFCLQSFPASGSFPVSQLFTCGWYWLYWTVQPLPIILLSFFKGETGSEKLMKLAQVHMILFKEVFEQKCVLGKLIWQCV